MAVTEQVFLPIGDPGGPSSGETLFNFTFEYIQQSDVKVSLDGVDTTAYTFANASTIQFDTAPADGVIVRIYRDTNIDTAAAVFATGSVIRAQDLNNDFDQIRFVVQELDNNTWDNEIQTIKTTNTWVSDDNHVATTASIDARFQDEINETQESGEPWVSDDDRVPTTAAVDGRFVDALNAETIGGVKTFSDSPIVPTPTANTQAANKVYVDSVVNNSINEAITNDIGTDGTGITVTDDGDGTITLGIAANSVDLDRIKNDDLITQAEQDAGATASDNNLFTALAAARRFDTFVQTATPIGSDWEVGKTWLQNDPDRTLSIWDGASWVGISSGGTFTSQTTVVYVDAVNGDDANDGHRISRPKQTIKAAINQINSEIDITLENGGSGYVAGSYTNVPLTGGTGTGLQADITVNGSGVVTDVTLTNASVLVDSYTIGETLSADAANLGGTGSGLVVKTIGTGDGQVVVVAPGIYQEVAPIQIKRRDVSIIGQALRSCIVHPTVATEENVLFEVNSGSFLQNLTLTGIKASGTRGGNALDTDATYGLPTNQGWNVAFYNNAFIIKSPYIQNCTNFSDSEIDNSDLNAHRPAGGSAGDTDSAVTGGGLLIDGTTVHPNSPLRSMVCDSYTHVGLDGPGIFITNNGYCQATSSYAFFCHYHIKCLNGGQANLAASTSDFGRYSLIADGKSPTAIFTATTTADAADQDITFTIDAPTADASWHGTATRPQGNMLVEIGGNIYPVLSATANGAGWDVTISRPNPSNRSENLGLDGAVLTGATVSFYLRSMIASSGHTMEYVGSGTDYRALPENGGVPIDANQLIELNNGKVWTAITDHNGKFKVGDFFQVDQRTGFINFSAGSYAFDVVTDTTPELGGQLDALTNKIVNLGDPTSAQDAATKNYVDTNALTTSDIGVTVQAYDANLPAGNTILVDGDIGTTVQPYDATYLVDADIGVNVQAYDATILKSADIDVTVQSYDADTVKTDVLPTFTVATRTTERTITDVAFDLATGNLWAVGAITVPNPTNAVAGQTGAIRITAGPVVWSSNFKFPGGSAPTITTFPAIIPYYVQDSTTILMGNVVEGIA